MANTTIWDQEHILAKGLVKRKLSIKSSRPKQIQKMQKGTKAFRMS